VAAARAFDLTHSRTLEPNVRSFNRLTKLLPLTCRIAYAVVGALIALTSSACSRDSGGGANPDERAIVIAAAGDIACDPDESEFNHGEGTETECRQRATGLLLGKIGPDAVLALGDNQYSDGTEFEESYDPTWGRFKRITYPVPGNHEYMSDEAKGYYAYFGARAGKPDQGYYSFDLGAWHLIALNANCPAVGGCEPDSPQGRWLERDLKKHQRACTLAFWHQPRFSSGFHGDYEEAAGFWEVLHPAGVDVVLTGHDHDYERFTPQDPSGRRDPDGIRQFVVGTGGKSLRAFEEIEPTSEARSDTTYGVLRMSLAPTSYEWRFVPLQDGQFTDSGRGDCH
jgi:calcineurin-like phosphoesterase family protein